METIAKIKDIVIQFNGSSTYWVMYENTDIIIDRVDTERKAKNRLTKAAKLAGYLK